MVLELGARTQVQPPVTDTLRFPPRQYGSVYLDHLAESGILEVFGPYLLSECKGETLELVSPVSADRRMRRLLGEGYLGCLSFCECSVPATCWALGTQQ